MAIKLNEARLNEALSLLEFEGVATMFMRGRAVGLPAPCRIRIKFSDSWDIDREVRLGPAPEAGFASVRIVGHESDMFIETEECLVPKGGIITIKPAKK